MPRVPNAQTVSVHALALERARALHGAGRSAEARGVCETILTGDPAHREALYVLGIIHARSKDFAAALPVFETLTTLDPSHAGGWFHRGMALIGLERFEEAADSLHRTASARPDDAMGHFWHGFALTCLDRYGAAAPVLARAHALAPDHAEIRLSHATTLLWTGKAGEAMRHYKTLAHRPSSLDRRRSRRGARPRAWCSTIPRRRSWTWRTRRRSSPLSIWSFPWTRR